MQERKNRTIHGQKVRQSLRYGPLQRLIQKRPPRGYYQRREGKKSEEYRKFLYICYQVHMRTFGGLQGARNDQTLTK